MTSQETINELAQIADRNIYALEETLEMSKRLGVAIGHKRVYARVKLIAEYEGKLKAWREMKEILGLNLDSTGHYCCKYKTIKQEDFCDDCLRKFNLLAE